MSPVATIGSVTYGVCTCHDTPRTVSGVVISGASTVLAKGRPMAQIGSIVKGSCGHTAIIISGSANVLALGRSTAYLGSQFKGCYSGTVVSGDAGVLV